MTNADSDSMETRDNRGPSNYTAAHSWERKSRLKLSTSRFAGVNFNAAPFMVGSLTSVGNRGKNHYNRTGFIAAADGGSDFVHVASGGRSDGASAATLRQDSLIRLGAYVTSARSVRKDEQESAGLLRTWN